MDLLEPRLARSAAQLADLGPLAQLRAGGLQRRLVRLVGGLCLYGMSLALMVRAGLGLAPWDVLHSGLTRFVPITLGQMVVAMSFVVLLGWIPLREKPGIGTVANAFLIGLSADAVLAVLGDAASLWVQVVFMFGGVVLCGVATALYIGSQLGRGPRDGLMTGLARRTGWSIRAVRTGLEVSVVGLGMLLGGKIGLGTVVFAVTIGPITQALLPLLIVDLDR